MKRILITYATLAGSTAEVANAIAEEIGQSGDRAEVLPIAKVGSLAGYDGVILGGPMMLGWHRSALGFLKKHRNELRRIPFAIFVLCMSLTRTSDMEIDGVPITIDAKLPKPPVDEARMTFHERYSLLANYLRPILRAARPSKPTRIAVFGGRLEYGRLPWWAVLFAMFVVRAPAGDKRNWDAIRE